MGVSCRTSSSSAYSSDILSTIWLHRQMRETAGRRGVLRANLMFAFSTQRKQRGASNEGAMDTKEREREIAVLILGSAQKGTGREICMPEEEKKEKKKTAVATDT